MVHSDHFLGNFVTIVLASATNVFLTVIGQPHGSSKYSNEILQECACGFHFHACG
jgi:hypothetical protein